MAAARAPKRARTTDVDQMERGQAGFRPAPTFNSLRDLPSQERKEWEGEEQVEEATNAQEPQPANAPADGVPFDPKKLWFKAVNAVNNANKFNEDIVQKRRQEPLTGYPAFAEFLGSDERWMMCRGFSHLRARLILEKQDDIRILEGKILDMDEADKERSPRPPPGQGARLLTSRHRPNESDAKARKELMAHAETLYKEYADLLDAAHKITTFEKPAPYEWKSVSRFISNTKPVVEREAEWIAWRNDIVTLRGAREHAYLGAILEMLINRIKQSRLFKHLVQPAQQMHQQVHPHGTKNKIGTGQKASKMQEWLDANAKAERLADMSMSTFLLLLVPFLFVVPIYALSVIGDNIGQSIGVLIGFAIALTLVLAAGTPAKPHEVLSGSAAYLAVLVVFFGSVSPNRGY